MTFSAKVMDEVSEWYTAQLKDAEQIVLTFMYNILSYKINDITDYIAIDRTPMSFLCHFNFPEIE